MSMRTGQLDGWLAKGVVDNASDRYAYTMTEDRLALIIVGKSTSFQFSASSVSHRCLQV